MRIRLASRASETRSTRATRLQATRLRAPRLYDEADLPWIARLLDIVEQSVGEPWWVLAERVEYAPLPVHRTHRAAILQALRRVLRAGGRRTRIARRARALVGEPAGLAPALEPAERRARVVTAAATLGIAPDEVEALLWAEQARERPVALPEGRPAEAELAAFANLARIQRREPGAGSATRGSRRAAAA